MHAEGLGSGREHQENVWGQKAVSAWGCRGGGEDRQDAGWDVSWRTWEKEQN